jgi:hypothetical protein
MRLEHKSLGVSVEFVDEILNRHVDAWMAAMRDFDPKWRSLPFSDCATAYVRAASMSEMLNGFESDAIEDMKPAVVHWLASEIDGKIAEALVIPPE